MNLLSKFQLPNSSSLRLAVFGLIRVKEEGRTGFSEGWQGCSEGNPEEQPCQPEENSVLSDSFTQIYILFLIGFRIGPPKMHWRFRIGLPKIHRRFRIGPPKIHRLFRIGPPQVTLNLIMLEFHSRWILVYHGYYGRKATKLPIWNRIEDIWTKGSLSHSINESIN